MCDAFELPVERVTFDVFIALGAMAEHFLEEPIGVGDVVLPPANWNVAFELGNFLRAEDPRWLLRRLAGVFVREDAIEDVLEVELTVHLCDVVGAEHLEDLLAG